MKVYGFYSLINAPSFVRFKEQRIFTFFFLVMSVGCGHGFQLPFLARVSLFRKKNTTDDTKLMNFFSHSHM